jgi:hypothetical protein
MTVKQRQTYERAMEVAKRDGLEVVAHGTRKSDGAAVYAVPSRSKPGQWHLVVVEGLDLVCTCAAGQHGRYCAHRAAVRARLELEAAVRRDTHEREVERTFHAAARALNVTLETAAAPAPGRSPKPRDDQRVFSLYK